MGTLLAFTAVAVSILILRYIPPDITLVQSPSPESISDFDDDITDSNRENPKDLGAGYHTQKGVANVCFISRTPLPNLKKTINYAIKL